MKKLIVPLTILFLNGFLFSQSNNSIIPPEYYHCVPQKEDSLMFVLLRDIFVETVTKDEGFILTPKINNIKDLSEWIYIANDYLKKNKECNESEYKLNTSKCFTKYFQIEIMKDDLLPLAYSNRASMKFEKKDYYGAINDLQNAIEIKTEIMKNLNRDANGLIYYKIGLCYIALNDKKNACLNLSNSGEFGFEAAYKTIKEYCQ